MSTAALIITVIDTIVLFGVRSWIHWRRTGHTGVSGVPADAPVAEKVAALAFTLAIVSVYSGALMGALAGPTWKLPGALAVAGLAVVVAGSLLAFVAQIQMGESWRIGVMRGERTELVDTGLFARVRNPIFSGMGLIGLGLPAMTAHWSSVAGAILTIAALQLQVRSVEEPHLLSTHGQAYRSYAGRVGRFVPGVGRDI